MFEYNGMTFTLDQLEEKAKSKGVTLQEYLASNPEIIEIAQEKPEIEEVKTEAVAEDVANVTAVNEQIATGQSTDLGSEDISLDLEKINNINQNFQQEDASGGITTDVQPLDVLEEEDLELYINDLIKTRKDYLKTKQEENKVETEVVETFANIKANMLNVPTSLKSSVQDVLASSVLIGKNILEPIVGEREVLTDLWLDLMENSKKTKEEMLDVSVNIYGDDKDKGSKFIEGVRTGDVSDIVGGAVTGMTSIVTTMVPAILTGGASLVPQIVGPMISDYNIEKANALFPESDNPLEELENSGETEVFAPLTLGTLAAGLEFVGFKGISKAIMKSAFNYKGLVSLISAGGGEGTTEWAQLGIETTSNAIARGEDKVDAAIEGLNAMASDQGAEAWALGFIGAVTFGGAGQVRQANAYRALRNDSNGVKIFNSSIQQMGDIKREMKMSKSKPYQEALQVELQEVENNLKTYLENNQKILNFLTVEQKNELVDLIENKDKINIQAQELLTEKNEGKITKKQYGYAIRSLNNQKKKIDNSIFQIRETVNLEQVELGIQNLEKVSQKFGLKVNALNTTKEYEQALDKLGFKGDKKAEALQSEGFILPNGQVLINKERAAEVGAIGVASHELLHRIIQNDLSDSKRRNEIVESFKKQLSKKELDIVQKRIDENYRYNEDGSEKDISEYNEEYLTAFSDAVRNGEISYEQTLFEKIGDTILKIIKPKGYAKASFESGRDVYNFIKEYQREFSKGRVTQRAEELSKVKATKPVETKLSKTIVAENKRLSEQLKTATAQEAIDIKNDLALNNEGIVNDFVNSKFKSGLGITKSEFKSGVQEEVLVYLNRTYDPSKGEYGAYLREGLFGGGKFGGGRLGNILKRLGQEGDLFTREIDDRTTPETLDTTTEETTEKIAEKPTKAKESLRKKIKLDKATTQKVIDAVIKTFGTKLPPVDSPQFKKALQKAFRTELKTTIAKDVLGSRAAYETFLRDNFENIYEAIPQDIINKRFRPFAEDTGKREKTKEGKKIFKKKDITKAEFIKYFLGRDVGTSTKGTRKDALAEALAEEFAFDATMEVIQKPEVIEKREFVDKTQTTEKVSKAISRPIDLKFSKTASNNQNLNRSLRSLKPEDQTIYRGLLPEFISSIAIDNYNVDAAFQSVFGNFLNKSDGTPSKKREEIISEWKKVRKSIIKNQKDFKTGKPKKININDYLTQAFEEQTETEVVRNILGVANGGVNFRDDKQIMGYVNFMNELVGSKMQEFKGNDLKIADYVVNILGPTLSAGAKVGGNNFMWELNNETNLLHLVPSTLKRSDSLRTSIFGNQKEMSEVLIKPFLKKPELLTYKGNAPQYNGKPLLKPKVAQKVDTYVTSLNKTGGISKNMLDDSANYAKKNQNAIIDILDFYKGLNKESEITINDLAMFFAASNGDMTALVRAAARVDSFAKSNSKNKKDYRYEHNPPARTMLVNMAKYVNGQMTLKELKKGFDSYTVSIIPKQMDDVINERYKDSSPLVGSRYYNSFTFGRFPFSMTVYEKQNDGNYKTKILGAFAPQAYKEVQAAKAKNINSLPSKIQTKFSKTSSNQNVLNEMERLDTEAQDARIKFSKSKNLNKDFNDIIERATGIGTEKRYGQTKARAVGADKGKFNLLGIPPSAQDFVGLTRYFAGKGKQGDETIAWVKENFLDPFARANIDISNARVALANDFKALKKLLGVSPKDLNKKITGEPYTVGNAVRVYTWIQQGMTIPGLSKTDQKILEDYVTADENLVTFANELIAINKDNGYPKPTDGWLAGTITTDLLSGLNTVVRAKYLKQWQNNVDEVFSETNMNKLEAAYGKGYRDALENMLGRMKTGSNRGFKGDTLTGRFIDWINNSVGAIMFFNMRSAVLQTISAVNFVNWSDNNPLKAAAAFGNQPQYWSDVIKLMNSDYLVERRNGLKINVSEADIAEIAAESKNKAKAFISKILKLGFLPTQIADSFAIASGGATFYRNRYKSLKKEGLSDKEAEAQAFQDFREIAEESQQSSRPDRISQQQAGPMGRIILAFANTPAQYARLMQKAASDLKNRRGDDKTNISKILYYGAIQNVIFNALQQALFAMAFGDEEPDEEKLNKKYTGIANGMADSLLRGVGFHGAAISTLKNVIMKLAEGKEAQDAAIELLDISPPISSKIGKLKSAGRTWDWNKKEIMEKGWSLDNPAYLAAGQVISAATNVPLDRGIRKLQNLKDASDAENEEWMRVANALGWAKWELEWTKDKSKNKFKKRKIQPIFSKNNILGKKKNIFKRKKIL